MIYEVGMEIVGRQGMEEKCFLKELVHLPVWKVASVLPFQATNDSGWWSGHSETISFHQSILVQMQKVRKQATIKGKFYILQWIVSFGEITAKEK